MIIRSFCTFYYNDDSFIKKKTQKKWQCCLLVCSFVGWFVGLLYVCIRNSAGIYAILAERSFEKYRCYKMVLQQKRSNKTHHKRKNKAFSIVRLVPRLFVHWFAKFGSRQVKSCSAVKTMLVMCSYFSWNFSYWRDLKNSGSFVCSSSLGEAVSLSSVL